MDRSWLTPERRAKLARDFDCDPSEVEARLDARKRMNDYIAERMEREGHPFPRAYFGRD